MHGFLLVDKAKGLSSQNVVHQLNRHFQLKKRGIKIGHGGTLDPNATGLMVIAIGKATRLLRFFLGSDKRYLATIHFGTQTTTDDTEGVALKEAPFDHIDDAMLKKALQKFTGDIMQLPPNFSALHLDGKRAYELARQGLTPDLKLRPVKIHTIDCLSCELPKGPELILDIACSGGTYIRSIARDLGLELDSAAHLAELRRSQSCHFNIKSARKLEDYLKLDKLQDCLISPNEALHHFDPITIDDDEAIKRLNGLPIGPMLIPNGSYRIISQNGQLLAILEKTAESENWLRYTTVEDFKSQHITPTTP